MDASARSLGSSTYDTFVRVHLPILAPSVLAAMLLVFVDVMKELPATLVLRPFNFDTLAVAAYQLASDERLGEAALPALTIVAGGVIPVALLSRAIARAAWPRARVVRLPPFCCRTCHHGLRLLQRRPGGGADRWIDRPVPGASHLLCRTKLRRSRERDGVLRSASRHFSS